MTELEARLAEEYLNLFRLKKEYEEQITELPRGSIQKKIIKGRNYYYLQYREDGHVRSKYIRAIELDSIKDAVATRQNILKKYEEALRNRLLIERLLTRSRINVLMIILVISHIAPAYSEIRKVTLFGSRSGDSFRDDSDVDLIFEADKPVSLMRQNAFRLELEEALGLSVDLVHGPVEDSSFLDINKTIEVYAA